jgi:NAD(P)-dependent dehydrogenase (short-subunit alcohol dehydrogenase family)
MNGFLASLHLCRVLLGWKIQLLELAERVPTTECVLREARRRHMTDQSLEGKTAIVTGAAGGFGRVLVKAFLAKGARVAALDIDENGLERLRKEVSDISAESLLCDVVDIADYAACAHAVRDVLDKLGGLHILINNGAMGMGTIRNDHMTSLVGIREIEPDVWQRFVAVNMSGAWNLTRASIAHLLDQRWGRIVNVTTSFFTMLRGGFHPYGPCKAGLEAMSRGHAQEFEGTGVTVNIVVPGGPANTLMVPDEAGFEREDLVQPEVMAPPIMWLCSDAAAGITGNRYIAQYWDASKAPAQAEEACRAPAAWPDLAQTPVWPGNKPGR